MSDTRLIHTIALPDECIRKDMGDLDALAASIDELGMLQPLVLLPDDTLLAGRRRLEAARKLGWDSVPVRVTHDLTDALKQLKAQRDENTCRKAFTHSEAVAIKKLIAAQEKPKAEARQKEGRKQGGKRSGQSRKKSDDSNGRHSNGELPPKLGGSSNAGESKHSAATREAAKETGVAPETLRKAEAIVDAAAADPEKFGDLKEQMDATGKVDPAFKELKKRQGAAPSPAKAKEEDEPIGKPPTHDALGLKLEGEALEAFAAVPLFHEAKSLAGKLAKTLNRIAKHPGGRYLAPTLGLEMTGGREFYRSKGLAQIVSDLKFQQPHGAACPYCAGRLGVKSSPDCDSCKGAPFVPLSLYQRSLPPEYLEAVVAMADPDLPAPKGDAHEGAD